MDMKISGSGTVPAGEFENIKISGSGRLAGHIKCASLHASGAVRGDSVECSGDIHVSGSAHFEKEIKTGSLYVSGAMHCNSDLTATQEIRLSGGVHCEGKIKCGELRVSGGFHAEESIEAETVSISGGVATDGLLNAEDIEIKLDGSGKNTIGSIGCSKLLVEQRRVKKLFGIRMGYLNVKDAIEGDEIDIEYVTCPRVSGRTVKVGKGCKIELLQYGETYEIHEKATVGRIEKI